MEKSIIKILMRFKRRMGSEWEDEKEGDEWVASEKENEPNDVYMYTRKN